MKNLFAAAREGFLGSFKLAASLVLAVFSVGNAFVSSEHVKRDNSHHA